jgi:uncharacterized protein (UPF0333 family)
LIIFLIIAVAAFCISSAFASLTIHEDNDSYKLISLDNDSFEPDEINYVPTIKPKNNTNTTNNTIENVTYTNDTDEDWNTSYDDWEDVYEDWYDE